MGVANAGWNAFAPASVGGYLGVGDFVPGQFPLPQGPVAYLPSAAGAGMSPGAEALATSAFGPAWGA